MEPVRAQLNNARIILKKIVPDYVPLLYQAAYESREQLKIWLLWCHSDYKIEETNEWVNFQQTAWNDKLEYSFGIFEVGSNNFVGGCGINQINWMYKIGNLGYWIRTDATRKGFASAAVKLCAEFGFVDLQLNRIEIVAAKENIASQKVAEKAGAAKECLARKRLIVRDKVYDAFVYSLIKEDIVNNKKYV